MALNLLLITFGDDDVIHGTPEKKSLKDRLLTEGFTVTHKALNGPISRLTDKDAHVLTPFDRIIIYAETIPSTLDDFLNWVRSVADHQKLGSRVWVFCFAPTDYEAKLDNYGGVRYLRTPYLTWFNGGWADFTRWLQDPWHGFGEKPDYTTD